jgi:DNA-binding Lrp family transcriptional regulator
MNLGRDSTNQKLINLIQAEIPVVERPFAALGEKLGRSEAEVIERIDQLKADKIIRQISAIFDTRSLGYASSLVACKCDPQRVGEVAAVISQHPGVSHNYERNHEFNLWYTIAVSPQSELGLEKTVERLHRQSGAQSTRLLPTLKLFKIGVRFDLSGENKADEQTPPSYTERNRGSLIPLTTLEIQFVRILQRNLPIRPAPFVDYAREIGVSLAELQAIHARFLKQGKMRRFAAVLNHRQVGFGANAMGVWAVRSEDDAALTRIGAAMAGFRAVSHCYRRPTYPDWRYNLFTMVHGRSTTECEQVLKAISDKTGVREYAALYSTHEYKKVRVRYFTREELDWETKFRLDCGRCNSEGQAADIFTRAKSIEA